MYYKIVSVVDGVFYSACKFLFEYHFHPEAVDNSIKFVKYHTTRKTTPKAGCGPLAAFKTFAGAEDFLSDILRISNHTRAKKSEIKETYQVWECSGQPSTDTHLRSPKSKKMPNGKDPILLDSIKLVRKIK